MANLAVDQREITSHTRRLAEVGDSLGPLSPRHQKMVAEILLLRLFAVLEATAESITVKLMCGTAYLDGTVPQLLVHSAHAAEARLQMATLGRKKRLHFLKWTQVSEIKKNIANLMAPIDPLLATLDRHEATFEEMRCVRNHIAHRNSGTRTKYKPVVERYYGAYIHAVTPGTLLLTDRNQPRLLDQYIIAARVIVRDLIKAPP